MRVVVAAAGPQTKWGGHLGVRSHFAPVRVFLDQEQPVLPLLERTLLALGAYTADVWVTAPPDAPGPYEGLARAYRARVHTAGPEAGNELDASRPAWSDRDRTVLLLGDVYWTDAALAAVLGCGHPDVRVFGREAASETTGTPWGEIFALSWTDSTRMGLLADAVRRAHTERPEVRPGWLALRLLQGTPLGEHTVRAPWWVEINDATDDIDFPADYARHPATRGLA
ncbi:hypothetical protein [Streptomyces tendae]|uniref:NTP transferase domain-containing protein n=1 Tax=Streptomyces tendae TaxID=1932 RepID=A0ABW7SCE8_STRTE